MTRTAYPHGPLGDWLMACAEGDLVRAKKFHRVIKNVDAPDMFEQTALHKACRRGKYAIVRYLLSEGAEVNQPDMLGYSPCQYAAHYHHSAVVRLLVAYGADINYHMAGTSKPVSGYAKGFEPTSDAVADGSSHLLYKQKVLHEALLFCESSLPRDIAGVIGSFLPVEHYRYDLPPEAVEASFLERWNPRAKLADPIWRAAAIGVLVAAVGVTVHLAQASGSGDGTDGGFSGISLVS